MSHWENHYKAAELHEAAAHAHRKASEHRGEQDHLTGHEYSRQALEHSRIAHEQSLQARRAVGREEIAVRAHEIWVAKGRPEGSAEADWHQAVKELSLDSLK